MGLQVRAEFLHARLGSDRFLTVTPERIRGVMAPIVARECAAPGRLASEVEPVVRSMRAAGLPVPIETAAELPLFWHDASGARHRVSVVDGGDVEARFEGAPRVAPLAALEENPASFSPDALLRVLIQDELFAPFATVVGPTELAYQLELAKAYSARSIARPLLVPRGRVVPLEHSLSESMTQAGIEPSQLSADLDPVQLFPSPRGAEWVRAVEESFAPLRQLLTDVGERANSTLARRLQRTLKKWEGDMEKVTGAMEREIDEGVAEERRVATSVRDALWPQRVPVERRWSGVLAFDRAGDTLADRIRSDFDPFDERASLLVYETESREVRERTDAWSTCS